MPQGSQPPGTPRSGRSPYVMAADDRPDGLPKCVFDDFQAQLAVHGQSSTRPPPPARSKITVPVLVLHGEDDQVVDPPGRRCRPTW